MIYTFPLLIRSFFIPQIYDLPSGVIFSGPFYIHVVGLFQEVILKLVHTLDNVTLSRVKLCVSVYTFDYG